MTQLTLEPLMFLPILKSRIWGGDKLEKLLNKNTKEDHIGESWEISDVEGDVSIVTDGPFRVMRLSDLVEQYKDEFLGGHNFERFGSKFPLLIKFIDAKTDLSIQLHPNDELAFSRHNSFGKNEMWYIMQADEQAKIIVDFNQPMNAAVYQQHLEDGTLPSVMNYEQVSPGDAFMIDVGRVHAIGGGVMLAEIKQTSDVTYRLYDWNRLDDSGRPRELHTDLALEAINFELPKNFRRGYNKSFNASTPIVECPYFSCNYLEINEKIEIINKFDSFLIYICIEGDLTVNFNNNKWNLVQGQTLLIPAAVAGFEFETSYAKLLEVYV